mmetsp:Transcript_83111/g.220540  ORF Transcript_83111/g.220540 Transcript_83111/m.220540 type:complete len:228 (-) Transcript_83111:109-792(-)|eukprot:CAMPEP_0171189166 /NCGR_PEP_ID=MMETSP0790-20130122/18206_1 /TAXON_ID=2925 /ORGANISM="Alexandrium catenella, Strain OF101" /LENGTH=227 /DNA_ID=CAMNT_0011654269 /DNA_START=121 /DNA_END=804 /DNA_ORIENTATION=-
MSDAFRAMSRNAILVKDDIGRAKQTCYDLPHEGHAYGRAEMPDLEGAREVTMNWASHVPRPKPGASGQDFKLINKMATRSKVASAKDLAEFRRNNDFPLTQSGPAGVLPKVIPSDVIPSFAYGRKSRPSTPISAVVGGHYAAEYEDALDRNYSRYAEEQGPPGPRKVKLTKAATDRISDARTRRAMENSMDIKEPFKMKKFSKVSSRLHMMPMGKSASSPALQIAAM